MNNSLYIIGNGFDSYHGLPTSYKCFMKYMMQNHPEAEKRIGGLFDSNNPDKLWSDFENQLEYVNALNLVKSNIGQWLMMEEHEFKNCFDNTHLLLQEYFKEWIEQININSCNGKRLNINTSALYLTFNYSNLLERVYTIPRQQICYIHGDTMNNPRCKPVVGHSRKNNPIENQKKDIFNVVYNINKYPYWTNSINDFAEYIIQELNCFWEGLAKQPALLKRSKDTIVNYYINEHLAEFSQYKNLMDIYVLGHSLGVVDKDYFKFIYELSPDAHWHISIKEDKESASKSKMLSDLLDVDEESLKVDTFMLDSIAIK